MSREIARQIDAAIVAELTAATAAPYNGVVSPAAPGDVWSLTGNAPIKGVVGHRLFGPPLRVDSYGLTVGGSYSLLTNSELSISVLSDSPTDPILSQAKEVEKTVAKQTSVQQPLPGGGFETVYTDIELRGHKVGLLAIKKALGQKGLKQSDLANKTSQFNSGRQLHQTSISGYLSGKVEMHDAVAKVLESLFTDAELLQMSKGKASAVPAVGGVSAGVAARAGAPAAQATATPSATQSGRIPSFARTIGSIPGEGGPIPSPTAAPKVAVPAGPPPKREFPVDAAYKVAEMARKANKAEELTATFSLRKIIMWGRAYYLLQQEGFSYEEALSGGFHLAVEGKTHGEEKTFLKNAYQAIFTHESRPPKIDKRKALKDGNRHPGSYIVEPMVREGIPVWVAGPTGSGKSFEIERMSAALTRPYYRIQGTGDMTVDDVLGGFAASAGTTRFEYGPLPLAMGVTGKPGILNIDEITACPAEVLFEFQAVLEGKDLVIKKNRGERVTPQAGFAIVACDNTIGLGENAEYIGTHVMNEAFRDRFLFCEFDYMPESQEKEAVKSELTKFTSVRGWSF